MGAVTAASASSPMCLTPPPPSGITPGGLLMARDGSEVFSTSHKILFSKRKIISIDNVAHI